MVETKSQTQAKELAARGLEEQSKDIAALKANMENMERLAQERYNQSQEQHIDISVQLSNLMTAFTKFAGKSELPPNQEEPRSARSTLLLPNPSRISKQMDFGQTQLETGIVSRPYTTALPPFSPPHELARGKDEVNGKYVNETRMSKIDFPRFNGTDVQEWLFKVENYFRIDSTPEGVKVGLACIHLEGMAAKWHHALFKKDGSLAYDWSRYRSLMEERFGEIMDDPMSELKLLQETNGTVFLSEFWREFFKLQGVELKFSTAYHPQSDVQTEVVNRCLEIYLRCICSERPSLWRKWLALAQYWYNTSFHSAIQMSPFEAVYEQTPPIHLPYLPGES